MNFNDFVKANPELREKSADEKLLSIEQHLKFFASAYTSLHNTLMGGVKVHIEKDFIDNVLNKVRNEVIELSSLRKEIQKQLQEDSIIGTLAFMAKKIHAMEQQLEIINAEGIKKKIHVDLTLDGYQMTKKKGEGRQLMDEAPEDVTQQLLKTLPEREAKALIHRYALSGGEKKTFNQIGALFGVTAHCARVILTKAIRKCRHPTRRELVNNLTHLELRKDILGE